MSLASVVTAAATAAIAVVFLVSAAGLLDAVASFVVVERCWAVVLPPVSTRRGLLTSRTVFVVAAVVSVASR